MIVFSMSKAEPLVDTDNKVCLWNFYFNAENDGLYATTSIGVNMKNGNLKPIEEWTKKEVDCIAEQVNEVQDIQGKLATHIENQKSQPKPIPEFNYENMRDE